ncbi:hypothetical protein ACVWXQ_005461 [Bradyrhizobium sp. S3.14.4]
MPTTPSGCGISRLRAGRNLQRGGHSLRRHPALQVLGRMPDLGEHQHRLGNSGLDGRAVAEIGRDCLPESLLVVGDHGAQPRQPVEPLGQVGRRLGPRPRDHGLEGILQRREWRARQGAVQGMVHGWSPLKTTFAPGFVARKLALCGTSGKSAPNGPEIGPTHCHKVEKNVPAALSKGSPGWYIRLSHPRGFAPGLPSKEAFGTREQATRIAPALIHRPRHFGEGAQRFNAGWSSPVARQAHNLKVIGSNPIPATKFGLLPVPIRKWPASRGPFLFWWGGRLPSQVTTSPSVSAAFLR